MNALGWFWFAISGVLLALFALQTWNYLSVVKQRDAWRRMYLDVTRVRLSVPHDLFEEIYGPE